MCLNLFCPFFNGGKMSPFPHVFCVIQYPQSKIEYIKSQIINVHWRVFQFSGLTNVTDISNISSNVHGHSRLVLAAFIESFDLSALEC